MHCTNILLMNGRVIVKNSILFFLKRKERKEYHRMEKIEKRVSDRTFLSEQIQIKHLNGILNAEVIDISLNGIGVLVDENIALNELCSFDIDYLKDNQQYAVKCLIVNKTPLLMKKKLRLGLVFKWENESQKQEIQSKIQELLETVSVPT